MSDHLGFEPNACISAFRGEMVNIKREYFIIVYFILQKVSFIVLICYRLFSSSFHSFLFLIFFICSSCL